MNPCPLVRRPRLIVRYPSGYNAYCFLTWKPVVHTPFFVVPVGAHLERALLEPYISCIEPQVFRASAEKYVRNDSSVFFTHGVGYQESCCPSGRRRVCMVRVCVRSEKGPLLSRILIIFSDCNMINTACSYAQATNPLVGRVVPQFAGVV